MEMIRISFVLIALAAICKGVVGTGMTVKVTADNQMEVFADGQLVGDDHWFSGTPVAKTFNIPTSTRVIGIKGFDWGGLGGIIALVSDGTVTDNSWKCSAEEVEGWGKPGFDDSNWASATTYNRPDGAKPSGVGSAQWIWTQNYQFVDQIVYCRKSLPTMTVKMLADNAVDLYVDGVYMGDDHWKAVLVNGGWNPEAGVLKSIEVPASAKVIGLRGFDYGVIGGIIASVGASTVTDSSWKCSGTYAEGWSTAGFNDGSWAAATTYARADARPPGIASSAKWIWTANYNFGDKVAYCRKTL